MDVLLVTNYIVNTMLILCTGKLSGRSQKRSRTVAAALFGGAASLVIFLPPAGFLLSIVLKLVVSAAITLIAFPVISAAVFLKQLFLFFAVSFSFAGASTGILLTFAPNWLKYYNGVVYFDISPVSLILVTSAAYVFLLLADRIVKGGRLAGESYHVTINIAGKSIALTGMVDTGNRLKEPFSNMPVTVCCIKSVSSILPREIADYAAGGKIAGGGAYSGITLRLIPYANIGGSGVLPAVKADFIILKGPGKVYKIEQAYIGLSSKTIGDDHYSCLLSPDLVGFAVQEKNTDSVAVK